MDNRFQLLVQNLSALAIQLNPAALSRIMTGADPNDIFYISQMIRDLHQSFWMFDAIALGKVYESLPEDNRKCARAGSLLRIPQNLATRLFRVWRDILREKIDAEGDAAIFPLRESQYYVTAVDRANSLGKTPLELIEYAVEQKVNDPSYTTTRFKRELLSGPRTERSHRIAVMSDLVKGIKAVFDADDQSIAEFVDSTPQVNEWQQVAGGAIEKLDLIRKALEEKLALEGQ